MYHQDICLQNKCINCIPQVCFYNNHPEAIQHTTVSSQCCRQCKAHDSKQDNITTPTGENHQHFQSLALVRTLQGIRMLISNRAPMNTLHRNYLLLQNSIVTQILQIYSYIVMYIPPVCTQSDHYLFWDQSLLVVTRNRHRKGACKKSTQFSI